MELGATVCTARAPRCDACPIADACAWRAAGYPAYDGARRPAQKRYEGSDRQLRGIILHELRSCPGRLAGAELATAWRDAAARDRAIAGLLADGLVEGTPESGYRLPV
jgi:A/G-specific adenine glycosylase